jgi:predicted XRE-type DNA-binding protein
MKQIAIGRNNVFRDLGLENADELQAKAILAHYIISAIKKRGLTQARAAQIIGATQPNVSDFFPVEWMDSPSIARPSISTLWEKMWRSTV